MSLLVKICGLNSVEAAEATARAGADMGGFVFFERSPRHLASMDKAMEIASALGLGVARVALTVEPSDETLAQITGAIAPDYFQLHGEETPERVREIKSRFGLPVIKACSISRAEDVAAAHLYQDSADMLLLDAKPPKPDGPSEGAERPGGWGETFDWSLLKGVTWQIPWLLAGGLAPENVAGAITATHPGGVDVSSGVETAPGVKSPVLIEKFVAAVRAAAEQDA